MKRTPHPVHTERAERYTKLAIFLSASMMILVFSLLAPESVGLFDKIGMELALIAIGVFLIHFPTGIFLAVNLFVISAAAGSILRVYDLLPGYDRLVHFASGIVLCFVGYYLAQQLFKRLKADENPLILTTFSFLFSCTGAGLWEIVEFTVDCVTQMGVQHGNTDTMGDIVAGFAGALCFTAVALYKYRQPLREFLQSFGLIRHLNRSQRKISAISREIAKDHNQ
ncbi:MAG: hypothetical protein ACLU8W_01600 [Clostridia bacterium]